MSVHPGDKPKVAFWTSMRVSLILKDMVLFDIDSYLLASVTSVGWAA